MDDDATPSEQPGTEVTVPLRTRYCDSCGEVIEGEIACGRQRTRFVRNGPVAEGPIRRFHPTCFELMRAIGSGWRQVDAPPHRSEA